MKHSIGELCNEFYIFIFKLATTNWKAGDIASPLFLWSFWKLCKVTCCLYGICFSWWTSLWTYFAGILSLFKEIPLLKIFLLNSVGLFLPLGIWSSKKEFCTMLIVRILSDHSESLLVPLQSQKHILERCNFINWLCLAAIVTTLLFSIISLPTPKIIVIDHWVYRIDFYPILLISLSALCS